MQTCAVTDDGVRCAVEYNFVRWGRHDLPPQAGIGVIERGPGGFSCRTQIEQAGTGRTPVHLAEILAAGLRGEPVRPSRPTPPRPADYARLTRIAAAGRGSRRRPGCPQAEGVIWCQRSTLHRLRSGALYLGQDLGGEEVEGALEPAASLSQVHLVEAGFLVGPDGLDVRLRIRPPAQAMLAYNGGQITPETPGVGGCQAGLARPRYHALSGSTFPLSWRR